MPEQVRRVGLASARPIAGTMMVKHSVAIVCIDPTIVGFIADHQMSIAAVAGTTMGSTMPKRPSPPELLACFCRIGLISFGGGLAAWVRRDIVERRGWLGDRQFLSGLAL